MPLADLLSDVLTPDSFSAFSYSHAVDHDEIDTALQVRFSRQTPGFAMDPMPRDRTSGYTWLLLHQQRHAVMNNLLGLTSTDLTKFDLSKYEELVAFVATNFSEHQQVRLNLGI